MTKLPETDHVTWLKQLVACPSVNPRGGPADVPPFGEARLNAMLAEILGGWGADIDIQEVMPGRTNLIARFAGADRDRCLMLTCHSDTVPTDGMKIDPFEPRIEDGRLYGRGACDTKGSMAAMLAALANVLESPGGLPTSVCFVATCNEEQGATGVRELVRSGFHADAAIVGEPTDLKIVDVHKGAVRFSIEIAGRAAHSSDPRRGINAISKAAAIIRRIDGPLNDELTRSPHPRLGPPVISVGIVQGGFLVNIIPDRCLIEIDRRLLPGETADSATEQLRRHIDAVAAAEPPLDYILRQTQYYPPLESDPRSPLGCLLAETVGSVTGNAEFVAAPWGSDAGSLHVAGIPVFVFGPGSISEAHSSCEFVDLDTVADAMKVYTELIRRFR